MSSTVRSTTPLHPPQQLLPGTLRWRNWPLVDQVKWSWLIPLAILLLGGWVYLAGGGWLLSTVAIAALAISLRSFLLPTDFEVTPLGLQLRALGRTRVIPWPAIRSYQRRPGGILLFQNAAPTRLDLVMSLFVPYPDDPEELLTTLQLCLPHAVEVP